jgi:hypothetical protein
MTRRHDHPDHYAPVETLRFSGAFADAVRLIMRKAWKHVYLPREPAKKRNEFSGAKRLDPCNLRQYLRFLSIFLMQHLKTHRIMNGASSEYYKKMHNRAMRAIIRSRKPFKHYGGI